MLLPEQAQPPKQEVERKCWTCKHYNLVHGARCDFYDKPFSEPWEWAHDDTKLPPGTREGREWEER